MTPMALGPRTIESSRDVEEMLESHRGMSQIIWSLKLWGLSFISDAETTTAMLCATSSTSVGGVNISDDIQADGPIDIPSRPPHTASLSRLLFTWSEGSLTSFKSPTQLQALEAIREGKDHMMVVMRTGGGKSLLWQLPAATFLSHQVTLVVVPFVALKEDIQRYMGGLCEEWTKKTETVKGKVSVFLVSLEQLKLAEFRAFAHMLKVQKRLARIVVDEAHVILTAGDYRGDVQHLPHLYTYGYL
ncbi:hypothetical protein BU17DRAFT_65812 [Hysterangium stoloniferum]|nr:hypothetical protein BU17DRAFT_65812 [Hysterangium stoloniferum]